MKNVSDKFKIVSKKLKMQDLKITVDNGELTVKEIHFMPVNMFNTVPVKRLKAREMVIAKELKYSFEGQLFKTIMQQVEITVKNAIILKEKSINFKYGLFIDNAFEYVNMGDFYIKDIEDNRRTKAVKVTGYDKMLNFMVPFKQSELQLTYPCTMKQLVNRMCEVRGVDLFNSNFFNSELIVQEDFFTVQQLTYRDVLEKVAQTTLTTIFIKDNKLYLCNIKENSMQKLDTSYLSNLIIGEKFGPVNALVLGRGSVEDNIESANAESLKTNKRCEIRFDENEFVDAIRETVIDSMREQIDGIEYYAVESSNLGLMWLEPCDLIETKDIENNSYKTIYLKASITITTGISGNMECKIPETTTTEYKITSKEEKKTLKVERMAKKNEGQITDLIKQQDEHTEQLSQHEQTIKGFKNTVTNMVDGAIDEKMNEYPTKTEMNTAIEQKADSITNNVEESKTSTISTILTLLNNGYLTAEQVEALVNGNAEDIVTIKEQLKQTITNSQMQIEISKAIEGGVQYLKNTLFTIDEKGMAIATNQDEFNALYNNKGMYLYSYDELIACYDKDGAYFKNLKITGELSTKNLRVMDAIVNAKNRVHIHWIGG